MAKKKMTDDELSAICQAKLATALGWLGGVLSKDRMAAQSYYRGDLFGNEQDGRSKVVSRDVAEAIDGAMPSLVKLFASTDQAVICRPTKPEDEEAAAQATDYLNWVWQTLPNWFDLLQTWLKSGLMNKIGVVKTWWDESEEVTTEEYEGLTQFQYMTLLSEEGVEEVECTTRAPEMAEIDPNQPPAPMQGQMPAPMPAPPPPVPPGALPPTNANFPGVPPAPPMPPPMMMPGLLAPQVNSEMLYDCTIKRTKKNGRVCVDALPPEEFLTDRRAVSLETATFAAHRCQRTITDLIEQGFDRKLVEGIPEADDMAFNTELINRWKSESEDPRSDTDNLDPSMRSVWVAEIYLKIDYDGDGVAEWRKVIMAGGGGYKILENEECDGHPFQAWTPFKSPHKLWGESMADKTMDLQLIKSTVWRQVMDGMYFNNAPQLVVQEGQTNLEDVLTRRPGGVIRVKVQGAVLPLPVQDTSASGFQMISYLDSVRETRTGIRRFSAGLNADELNPYASTATGINKVEDASQDALMLIARNFSEMGLKQLFKRMLELTCKYQDKARTIRLRGKWVNIDPSEWSTEMDMAVTVGLGTGDKSEQSVQLLRLLTQIDAPIVQMQQGLSGPILTGANLYNKLIKLTESLGFGAADNFYTDPATAPPQPPKEPDPKIQIEQMKAQAKVAETQAKVAADKEIQITRAQTDAAIEQVRAQAAQQNDEREAQLKSWLAEQDAARTEQKHQFDMLMKQVAMIHDLQKHQQSIELSTRKAERHEGKASERS